MKQSKRILDASSTPFWHMETSLLLDEINFADSRGLSGFVRISTSILHVEKLPKPAFWRRVGGWEAKYKKCYLERGGEVYSVILAICIFNDFISKKLRWESPYFTFFMRERKKYWGKRIKNLVFGGRANPSEFGTCENRSVKVTESRVSGVFQIVQSTIAPEVHLITLIFKQAFLWYYK